MAPVSVFSVLAAAIDSQLDVASRAASDSGPDGIHDLRVSTRRLRAALELWLDEAPGKKLERCRKRLKKLGRRLGSVREADVNLEGLANLSLSRTSDAVAIEFLAAAVARDRRRCEKRLLKERRRTDLPALFAEIRSEVGKAADSDGGSVPLAAAALKELGRSLPPLGRLLEDALRDPSSPALHRLRIGLKKFRYTVELCAPAYDGRSLAPLAGRLKALQDALGAAQDARVLHDRFAERRRALREDGLGAAERSLLPPMRAAAGILRARQEAARRELESCRRESLFSRFDSALSRDAGRGPRAPEPPGRSYTGGHAASARP